MTEVSDGPPAKPALAPEVAILARHLLPDSEVLGRRVADRIRAEVSFYRQASIVTRTELDQSCAENVRHILGRLAGEPVPGNDRARETGVRRSVQGVPNAAVLAAFRIGARMIWEFMVERADPALGDVLLRATADIWAVSDDLSATVTEAYQDAAAERSRRDRHVRATLVKGLFDGDRTVAGHHLEGAAALGFGRGAGFVVVSADCPEPGVETLPDVGRALERRGVTSVWQLEGHHQDGLVELRVGFDVQHLCERLAELAEARVGLSAVFAQVARTPAARHQSRLAAEAGAPGSRDLVRYDDQPLAVLLASAPQEARLLVDTCLGPVFELAPADRDPLLQTVLSWLTNAGSTTAVAGELFLHRNTVRYRLRRLEQLVGADLANPVDAAQVYLALKAARIHGLLPDPA